ncbi:uncharacterized protein CMC5_034010 [Chondromyces crocatus]|uniref:Protein kinase domain-containing protein n=1 Tax=Chondromyces crocatus TaxID=52 RepID=A0A0K1EFA5_CHOCO|nr:uncharacterized protein CMC5_034010 [Chondromyces crocatus]
MLGRYAIYEPIAAGGMARVYLGRQLGAAGFARTVAIKRMLPHLVEEQRLVTMFIDEARLAARIRHPNVVSILDVVSNGTELFLVMEYVVGDALFAIQRTLQKSGARVPPEIASSIVSSVLYGLHAAHEAVTEEGTPLGLVHRDVSPQNILVGVDGITRVLDFGVAKAAGRLQQTTQRGQLKGKLGYVAPEQLQTTMEVTRHADVYATGVVLWELLAGQRLFQGDNQGAVMLSILEGRIPSLAEVAPWVDAGLVRVVERAVARAAEERFASALEMANALERALSPASPGRVAAWVQEVAREVLAARAAVVTRVERAPLPLEVEDAPFSQRGSAPELPPPSSVSPWSDRLGPGPLLTPNPPSTLAPGAPSTLAPAASPGVRARPSRRRWMALAFGCAFAALLVAFAVRLGASSAGVWGGQGEPSVGSDGREGVAQHAQAAVPGSAPPVPVTEVASPDTAPDVSAGPGDQELRAGGPTEQPDGGTLDAGAAAVSTTVARPKNPCDPPYYVDKEGIQRVKRSCFPR